MNIKQISPEFSSRFPQLNKIAIEIIVAILLVVWLHTGISKLLDISSFRVQMIQSPIFHKVAGWASVIGPVIEILIAIMLLFKRTRLAGLLGSLVLMLFFSWYVYYLMKALPHLPCSCGGIVSFLSWPQHLALNIFLTIISLVGIILFRRSNSRN